MAPDGQMTPEPSTDFDSLKNDVAALREDLKRLMDDAGRVAGNMTSQQFENGKKLADHAAQSGYDAKQKAEETVKQYPLASIGIAFGLGALLATLRKK